LLRIQNDLNLLAVAMGCRQRRTISLTAWSAHSSASTDLDDAMRLEARLAPTSRTAEQALL